MTRFVPAAGPPVLVTLRTVPRPEASGPLLSDPPPLDPVAGDPPAPPAPPTSPAPGGSGGVLGRVGGLTGVRLASALLQAVALVVMARGLSVEGFAVFSIVTGVLALAVAVADFGCSTAMVRHHRDPAVVRAVVQASRALAPGSAVVATVALTGAAMWSASPVVLALVPLGPWIALERQAEMYSQYLVARRHTHVVGLAQVGRRSAVVLACLAALVTAPGAVVWAFSLSSLLGSAVAAVAVGRVGARLSAAPPDGADPVPAPSRRALVGMLVPFWATSVGAQVRQVDVLLVGAVGGVGAAAAYAPAARLIPPLRIVSSTYAQVLLGHLAGERRVLRRRELWLPVLASAVGFGAVALAAAPLLPLVIGGEYDEAVLPFQLAMLALVPAAGASILTAGTQAAGRIRYAAVAAWFAGGLTLLGVAVLTHLLGAPGAALATGLGFAVQMALLYTRATATRPGERTATSS